MSGNKNKPPLDPVTLRWIADDEQRDADRYAGWAKTSDPSKWSADYFREWREMASMFRRRAKRLRSLATRAERSKAK